MPQKMLTAKDIEERKAIMSTDGSITFFSAVDEDINITVESLKHIIKEEFIGDKMIIAKHNNKMSENEMVEQSQEQQTNSNVRPEVRGMLGDRLSADSNIQNGIGTTDYRYCRPAIGRRITRDMKARSYYPNLHYQDMINYAFLSNTQEHSDICRDKQFEKNEVQSQDQSFLEIVSKDIEVIKKTMEISGLMLQCFAAKRICPEEKI